MSSSKTAKRTLKIGFVFDDTLDNPDGVQQYIRTLGSWLTAQGHEVRYLVGQTSDGSKDIYSLSKNIQVSFNKNRLSIPLPAKREAIEEVLRKENFDALHIQLPCSPLMGGRVVAAADPRTVIVGTFHIVGHSWLEYTGAKLLSAVQKKTFERINHIVCVSSAAADFASDAFRLHDTEVVPNCIDTSRFDKGKKIEKYDDKKTNIVYLGRFVERKGCGYLIEAVRRLRDRGHAGNLRVLLGGKGPLEGQLRQKVADYKLDDIVEFCGFIPEEEKSDYLATADIAVFPSTGGESFGIVLIEAMAAHAGVVMAGNNVGYRTVLGEQANHLLFNPRNTQVFADKIELLLSNKKLRAALHAWQESCVQQYDVTSVGELLLERYQNP